MKNGLGSKLAAIVQAHPGAQIQLWCEDAARIGQKGRTCHRWYQRGVRPPGLADKRFESLYLFAACRPGTDEAFALALPRANAPAMRLFLEHLARQLEPGVHAFSSSTKPAGTARRRGGFPKRSRSCRSRPIAPS